MANETNLTVGRTMIESLDQFIADHEEYSDIKPYGKVITTPPSNKPYAELYTFQSPDGDFSMMYLVIGISADKENRKVGFTLLNQDEYFDGTFDFIYEENPETTTSTDKKVTARLAILLSKLADSLGFKLYLGDPTFKCAPPKEKATKKKLVSEE